MKIFFNASTRGAKEYLENYKALLKALEGTGHEIVAAPVLDEKAQAIRMGTSEDAGNYFQKMMKWIKAADICVFEVSYPSTAIGHEIATALNSSKPVVAFHTHDAPRNAILESMADERLQMIDYDVSRLDTLVLDAIDYASDQMDTRFNFFVSPKISAHLDWISKTRKVPRAVYLRRLIEEHMAEDEDYQKVG